MGLNNFSVSFLPHVYMLAVLVPACSAFTTGGVPHGTGKETTPTSELLKYSAVAVPNVAVGKDAKPFTFTLHTTVLDIE